MQRALQNSTAPPAGGADLRPFSLSSGVLGAILVLLLITAVLVALWMFFRRCFQRTPPAAAAAQAGGAASPLPRAQRRQAPLGPAAPLPGAQRPPPPRPSPPQPRDLHEALNGKARQLFRAHREAWFDEGRRPSVTSFEGGGAGGARRESPQWRGVEEGAFAERQVYDAGSGSGRQYVSPRGQFTRLASHAARYD